MAVTPHKQVHWSEGISISEFGTPFLEATSSDSLGFTSSLQYINSQLIAHGFTTSPGLKFDALSKSESECVAKCLLSMLSQRVEDMSRAEDLSTKLRTLSYDHERVVSMLRSSAEQAANAEREVNVYKSKLATATRSLQSAENAHKHTTTELQRTRASLQALRATHQSEIKKREKENERMIEKWTKVLDAQNKVSAYSSGISIRGANPEVVTGSELLGKGSGYLEISLEQAEDARNQFSQENQNLRRLIVRAVNETQALLYMTRSITSENEEEPTPLTLSALSPLTPESAANEKLWCLLDSLRNSLSTLSSHVLERGKIPKSSPEPIPNSPGEDPEVKRLQGVIEALRSEIKEAQQQYANHAVETQALLDQFAQRGVATRDYADISVDFMITPAKDDERERLDEIKSQLDMERDKFTDAAIKLGKERAALEAERIKLLDEQRSWKVEMMLAELPATPAPITPPPALTAFVAVKKSSRNSPRKSPVKPTVVGKAGGVRKTRVSRRSSVLTPLSPGRVEPAYETEVILPFRTKDDALMQSILPTSFVLPPPSPRTSLPPPPSLLAPSRTPMAPLQPPPSRQSTSSSESSSSSRDSDSTSTSTHNSSLQLPTIAEPIPRKAPQIVSPHTPPAARRPFPIAKPMAAHMIHAYSPVKPSPLSRILMLANSPDSPESGPLDVLTEESEDFEPSPTAGIKTLAAALGADDTPLRDKKTAPNVVPTEPYIPEVPKKVTVKRKEQPQPVKRPTTKDKGKSKAEPTAGSAANNVKNGAGEKENRDKAIRTRPPSRTGTTSDSSRVKPGASEVKVIKPPTKPATTSSKPTANLPPGKGGARRVPVGSAEAAPLPGWKG